MSARRRLLSPGALTLDPDPGRSVGVSYARARARALAAWRRGERELRVLARDGSVVAPEQIDWARVRAEIGSGSRASGRPAERVALANEAVAQLDALAARWCLSRSKAAARAIREATARSVPAIAQLDALAARWCLSRSKAAARAIREATARSVAENGDDRPQ